MKGTNLLLATALAIAVSSCQQEDTLGDYSSKEDAAREIGFIEISDMQMAHSRSSINSDINDMNPSLGIKARIARTKTGCKKGFGLCDIRAMNRQDTFVKYHTRGISSDDEKYECSTTCTIGNDGMGVMCFLLADSPKSQGLTAETMPLFCIDEEIEQPIEEVPENSLFVAPGAYIYQKELGQYGGYAVKVAYINKKHSNSNNNGTN